MAKIILKDTSLQFRVRQARKITLKEYIVRRLFRKSVNPVIEVNALRGGVRAERLQFQGVQSHQAAASAHWAVSATSRSTAC